MAISVTSQSSSHSGRGSSFTKQGSLSSRTYWRSVFSRLQPNMVQSFRSNTAFWSIWWGGKNEGINLVCWQSSIHLQTGLNVDHATWNSRVTLEERFHLKESQANAKEITWGGKMSWTLAQKVSLTSGHVLKPFMYSHRGGVTPSTISWTPNMHFFLISKQLFCQAKLNRQRFDADSHWGKIVGR